jgi:predicted Zn-dependent protease
MQVNIAVLIALGIALFGVIRFFTSSQKNPVTGEPQRVGLTPQEEVALGLQSAPQMAAKMGGLLPTTDPRVQFVRMVGDKLVAQIGVQHPWKFQFHVLADARTVNAFALPGGQCFITVALLEKLENEAQLAGVMGHEIGHVIERHSAERIAKSQLGRSLVTAVGVGASGGDGGNFAYYAAAVADDMIQKSYGRDAELESDRYGVQYMAKAGYDPREMVGVMKILKAASGGSRQPEFASTHPDPGNRAEQIMAIVKQIYPQGVPANLTKGATLSKGRPVGGGAAPPAVKW